MKEFRERFSEVGNYLRERKERRTPLQASSFEELIGLVEQEGGVKKVDVVVRTSLAEVVDSSELASSKKAKKRTVGTSYSAGYAVKTQSKKRVVLAEYYGFASLPTTEERDAVKVGLLVTANRKLSQLEAASTATRAELYLGVSFVTDKERALLAEGEMTSYEVKPDRSGNYDEGERLDAVPIGKDYVDKFKDLLHPPLPSSSVPISGWG